MRYIIIPFLMIFMFFGCTPKQTVQIKLPSNEKKEDTSIGKAINTVNNQIGTPITVDSENRNDKFDEQDTEEDTSMFESTENSIFSNENTMADVLNEDTIDGDVIEDNEDGSLEDNEETNDDNFITENAKDINKDDIIKFKEFKKISRNYSPIVNNFGAMKIAFIYPSSKVSKYAKTSINTIMGYLLFRNLKYDFKVIDSKGESFGQIQNAINKARGTGYKKIIALFTPNASNTIMMTDTSGVKMYFPLLSKTASNFKSNFIFGGISYDSQIRKLLTKSNYKNSMFYQKSFLGNRLKSKYFAYANNVVTSKAIAKKQNNFKYLVKDKRLNNSSVFLNTSIVKSSMLLSQLRAHEIKPHVILSTQINYNPKLFSLTQSKDRTKLIVASSIGKVNSRLVDTINTFGGNVKYNWVDYSSLVGVDYLYDRNASNLIASRIVSNQVNYKPVLYKTTRSGFKEIK